MSLLHHLWDDTFAGPPPENGLGKLRKQSTSTFRSSESGKGGEESGSRGSCCYESKAGGGSEAFRFRRKSMSDVFDKATGIGSRRPGAPYNL